MEIHPLFLAFLILLVDGLGNEKRQTGQPCLQCLKIAEAHDCETVTNCEADEECFTEQYITQEGHIFFDLGCKSKQICGAISKSGKRSLGQLQRRQSDGRITLCEECCTGVSCNGKGCDSYNSTKRMCYTCSGEQAVENPNDCETVTMCGTHEQCYQAYGLTNELEARYAMGCISDKACNVMYTSGGTSLGHPNPQSRSVRDVSEIYERSHLKRDMSDISFKRQVRPDGSPMFTVTSCEYCCNKSYCNKNECVNGYVRTAPPTTHTTTLAPTTPKTTQAPTTVHQSNAPTTHAPIPTTHASITPAPTSTSTKHILTTHAPTTKAASIAHTTPNPTTHASITPAPTSASTKHILTTHASTTQAATVAPTTPKPTTHAPITPAPTSASTTEKHTTHAPTTPAPSIKSTTHNATTPAPTTQSPTTRPTTSAICFVCSGLVCSNHSCTGATPYCLNFLNNSGDGSKQETKRCGNELECERDWYNKTALNDICSVYEPWQLYTSKFSCTYCCVRNYCNRDTKPPRETLYYPNWQKS